MAAIDDVRAAIEQELWYWYKRMQDQTFPLGHENMRPDLWVVTSLALAALEGERLLNAANSGVASTAAVTIQ